MSSMDAKLDLILANIQDLSYKFDKLESKVAVLQQTSAVHDQSIADLQKEVLQLKEAGNTRDQEGRIKVIRIFNLPIAEDEAANANKILASKVYERVLKPVLTAAKSKGDIASLPQQQTLIEDCFRARGPSSGSGSGPPPPVIVKLTSHNFKTALMKNKRDSIPAPSRAEAANGVLPCFVVEDLTPVTHKKMMELKADKRVAKIWTINGQIRLTLTASPESVIKVKSPYVNCEKLLNKK